jgi:hypothetical protein
MRYVFQTSEAYSKMAQAPQQEISQWRGAQNLVGMVGDRSAMA